MFESIIAMKSEIQSRYTNLRDSATKRKSSSLKSRQSLADDQQTTFEKCSRYNRRGIVISSSVDQMESMFIEPDTEDILVLRIDVHGKFNYL